MSYPMEPRRQEEVFDWAAYEPQQHAEVEPYRPAALPAVIPPIARVVQPAFGAPYYGHVTQPLPAYDPVPARRMSMAALILTGCVGLSLVEVCSWVFFAGLSMSDHALMSLGWALAGAAGLVFALKSGGGVSIKNFHQGDGANFQVGGKR